MEAAKRNRLIILAVILNAIGITMTALLIGYIKPLFYSLFFVTIALMIVLFAVGLSQNIEWLYKLVLTAYYIGIVCLAIFLTIIRTGLVSQFYNGEGKLDAHLIALAISSKKSSVFIFILLSFLQVTFLPIPSTVMTVVGAAVFGIGRGIAFSLIGQVIGSMVAFWMGKIFGKKIIVWMVGQDAFDKYNQIIRGRDKIVIVFMLLFPFFPDDLLCMFAGLTTFSSLSFFILILFTRAITVTYTSFGYGLMDKISALGPWAYVIYILFALFVVAVLMLVWKKGDIVEQKMLAIIDKITPKRFKKKIISESDREIFLTDKDGDGTVDYTPLNPDKDDLHIPPDCTPESDNVTEKSDSIIENKNNENNKETPK